MVNASGKMVLLHKLLPKLRSEGRKVTLDPELLLTQLQLFYNAQECEACDLRSTKLIDARITELHQG